jgi:hypothetical protein
MIIGPSYLKTSPILASQRVCPLSFLSGLDRRSLQRLLVSLEDKSGKLAPMVSPTTNAGSKSRVTTPSAPIEHSSVQPTHELRPRSHLQAV